MGGRLSRKRIPRIVTAVCVFLLLGAIVNVAVAWGCVVCALPHLQPVERLFTARERPAWFLQRYSATGMHVLVAQAEFPGRPPWDHMRTIYEYRPVDLRNIGAPPTATNSQIFRRDDVGWPFMCLKCTYFGNMDFGGRHFPDDVVVSGGIQLPVLKTSPLGWRDRSLPFSPVLSRFAINTLFYAGILWLMFVAPFALRRRRRIKRGLCPACAYPVGESEACTECGAAVHRSLRDAFPRRG